MAIKEVKIYDMDGTIVCSAHRYRTDSSGENIDLAHWRSLDIAKFISQDSLLPLAEEYKRDLQNPGIYVIIATARACKKGDANYRFIREHLGNPDKFIHRLGPTDNRGGAELKLQAIIPLLNLKQFANASIKVFEDNISYLKKMCDRLNATGIYIPSVQGY